MNALTYEVKRAHWRGTWHAIRSFRARAKMIGAPMLRHMTPARFDILYIAPDDEQRFAEVHVSLPARGREE